MKNKNILITSVLVIVSFAGGYFLGRSSGLNKPATAMSPGRSPIKVAYFPFNVQPTDEQKKALEKIEETYGTQVIQARQAIAKVITQEQQQKRAEASKKAIQEGKKGKELMDFVEKESGITPEQKEELQNAQRELGQLMSKMNTEINQLLTEAQKKEIEEKRQEIIKQNAARVEAGMKAATGKTSAGKAHSAPKDQSKKSSLNHHK